MDAGNIVPCLCVASSCILFFIFSCNSGSVMAELVSTCRAQGTVNAKVNLHPVFNTKIIAFLRLGFDIWIWLLSKMK